MNRRVIWVGRASSPDQAVPCPVCNVTIGHACEGAGPGIPHRERLIRAETFGFRAVAEAGPLFTATTQGASA